MLKVVATFDVYVGVGTVQVMPDAASIGAAPSVTRAHAVVELFAQYVKLVVAAGIGKGPVRVENQPGWCRA